MKKKLLVLAAMLALLIVGAYAAYWYSYVLSTGFRKKSLAAFEAVLTMGKSAMSETAAAAEKENAAKAAEKAVADAHGSARTRPDFLLDSLLTHELSNMRKFSGHVKVRTSESLAKASEDLKRVGACSHSINARLDGSRIQPEVESLCNSAPLD